MAEQDRYGSHFGSNPTNPTNKVINFGIPDLNRPTGAEQDIHGGHFSLPRSTSPFFEGPRLNDATAVGILRSAILPSLGFQSGLALTAYVASRVAGRVDGKDLLWPSGQVIHAWWSALGTKLVYDNLTLSSAWRTVSYPERVLLAGVTIWGTRLFYRVASRSISRGKDDPRYEVEKKDPQYWDKAFFTKFMPEALIQTIITLPFTLPFRDQHASALGALPIYHSDVWHSVAVGVFTAGMVLEFLADAQLAEKQEGAKSQSLQTEGVWSIVRHPNYLGDALTQASFPILLYSTGILHPLCLLGPIANYAFLRYIGGDKETKESQEQRYKREDQTKYAQLQEYKQQKNRFWPDIREFANPWMLVVIGAGTAGALVENWVKNYF